MKKTALQQMINDLYDTNSPFGGKTMISKMRVATIIRSYLATEREQIEQCYNYAYNDGYNNEENNPTNYFTKTYGNEGR